MDEINEGYDPGQLIEGKWVLCDVAQNDRVGQLIGGYVSPVVSTYRDAVRLQEAREANGYKLVNGYDLRVAQATALAVRRCGLAA